MSIYKVGCLVPTRGHAFEKHAYSQGMVVGGLTTQGHLEETVNLLDADVRTADLEIAREVGLPGFGGTPDEAKQQWWRSVWLPFMADWTKFRTNYIHWYDNLLTGVFTFSSALNTANKFRKRLIDIRKSGESQGLEFQAPEPDPPDTDWSTDFGNQLTAIGHFIKNLVYVGLVLVGGILVYKFFLLRRS